jgi:RNA-directed DNA polymerase
MLDVLDKDLEKRGHRFVRYADDCNIYVRSQRAGERVMAGIEKLLAKHLKLKVNKAKSAVAKPSVRKFLGFSFTGGKEAPRRRIAPQAVARFKTKVRELTRRTRGRSLTQIIKELSTYLIGWRGYFGFCQTPSVLRALDEWIRRRLRAIAWKQWKHGRARFAELRRRGVGRDLAAQLPAARMAPGGSRTALRLTLLYPLAPCGPLARLPSQCRGLLNPPNRRIRTRTSGGVGGEESRDSPLSRSSCRYRMTSLPRRLMP